MEDTFLGESYLLQGEEGSIAIRLDKDTICHYCFKRHESFQRTKINYMWRRGPHGWYLNKLSRETPSGEELRKSLIGRTVWWNNPHNPANRRWYCLTCVKEVNKGKIDFPSKWNQGDIELIRSIGKVGRKSKRPDHNLGVHYRKPKSHRLDEKIQHYIRNRNSVLRRHDWKDKSYFHDEPVRDDEYLRTAVLTALTAMKDNPYVRKVKGGRPPGIGAKSIVKWCKQYFTSTIPSAEWNKDGIVSIKMKFNERKIKDILTNMKNQ